MPITGNHDHLGSRHHRIAHLHLGYFDRPFHHCEHVGIQHAPLHGIIQYGFQFFAVPWLAGERTGDSFNPGFLPGTATRLVFAHSRFSDGAVCVSADMGFKWPLFQSFTRFRDAFQQQASSACFIDRGRRCPVRPVFPFPGTPCVALHALPGGRSPASVKRHGPPCGPSDRLQAYLARPPRR